LWVVLEGKSVEPQDGAPSRLEAVPHAGSANTTGTDFVIDGGFITTL